MYEREILKNYFHISRHFGYIFGLTRLFWICCRRRHILGKICHDILSKIQLSTSFNLLIVCQVYWRFSLFPSKGKFSSQLITFDTHTYTTCKKAKMWHCRGNNIQTKSKRKGYWLYWLLWSLSCSLRMKTSGQKC